jgi:hypothetical protein
LDAVVAHDLDAVAPGIVEIEEWSGQGFNTGLVERASHGFLVI